MKRTLVTLSVVALMAFTIGGCRQDKDCNVCTPYCDDSGCYNCDGSGCWLVENLPCESELECAADEVCTEYGCARPCSFDLDCGTECAGLNAHCDEMTHCTDYGCQCVNGYCYNNCASPTDCAENEICDFSGDPAGQLGSCKANYRPEE